MEHKIYLCLMFRFNANYAYKKLESPDSEKVIGEIMYKHRMGYAPGDIIEVISADKDGDSVYPKKFRIIGSWSDKAEIKEWVMKTELYNLDTRRKKDALQFKKDVIENMTLKDLKVLFSLYKSAIKRSSLIAYIIDYLWRY